MRLSRAGFCSIGLVGWLIQVLIWVAGCAEPHAGHAQIELVTICQPTLDQQQIELFCLSLEDQSPDTRNCATDLGELELRIDEYSDPVVVVIEGYVDQNGQTEMVVKGKSSPVALLSGVDTKLVVPLAPLDQFGVLAAESSLFDTCTPLPYPLVGHTATEFPSGHILLIGGNREDVAGSASQNAILLDTHQDARQELTTPASLDRYLHNADLLADGRVLVSGGLRAGLATDELVLFSGNSSMLRPYDSRVDYTADLDFALLSDVLEFPVVFPSTAVFLGQRVLFGSSQGVEMYRADEDSLQSFDLKQAGGPGFAFPKTGNTSTMVTTGARTAILAGGQANRIGRILVASEERTGIYNGFAVNVEAWDKPPGVLLADGRIVFFAHARNRVVSPGAMLVDPSKLNSSVQEAVSLYPMPNDFPVSGFTADRLLDGRIMVVGGETRLGDAAGTYYLDSTNLTPTPGPNLVFPRQDHTTSVLPDGRVLVIGGRAAGGSALDPGSTAEVLGF